MSANEKNSPLLTFGVIADVQYADVDNLPAEYDPTKIRYYRDSHVHIEKAFKHWESLEHPVHFTLQLGDIIDGLSAKTGSSRRAMKSTLEKFEGHSSIPSFHTIGNHELYNFKRHELSEFFRNSISKMNVDSELLSTWEPVDDSSSTSDNVKLYYKFCPSKAFKFISLDCFDVSVLGYDSSHPKFREAAKILERYHKHNIFENWDCSGHLKGLDIRFQQMNGAIGTEQLHWLEEELTDSDQKGQMVIVFGHVNLSPECTDWSCLLWNYEEVIECFHKHHCVVAYLSGHSHKTDRFTDGHGIHYIVFPSVVETPLDAPSFSTISIYPHQIEVTAEDTHVLSKDRSHHIEADTLRTASETVKVKV